MKAPAAAAGEGDAAPGAVPWDRDRSRRCWRCSLPPAAPVPCQDPAPRRRSVTPQAWGKDTDLLAPRPGSALPHQASSPGMGWGPQGWDRVPRDGTGSPGPLGAAGCSGDRDGVTSSVLQLVAGERPLSPRGAGGRWEHRMVSEGRWRPGGARPCAHRRWRASEPRAPSPGAGSFPPPATRAGFLISAPLYIPIAGAQNGNVQVSP